MAAIIAQRCPGASSGTNLSVWRSCVESLAARYPFPNTPDRPGASGPRCGVSPGSTSFRWSPGPGSRPGLLSFGGAVLGCRNCPGASRNRFPWRRSLHRDAREQGWEPPLSVWAGSSKRGTVGSEFVRPFEYPGLRPRNMAAASIFSFHAGFRSQFGSHGRR